MASEMRANKSSPARVCTCVTCVDAATPEVEADQNVTPSRISRFAI